MSNICLTVFAVAALTACGGGGSGKDSKKNKTTDQSTVVELSGQVVDGPIAGAKVCLYLDEKLAKNKQNQDVCSNETDAEGNYVLSIPTDLGSKLGTLIATKSNHIKLVSSLGPISQLVNIAKNGKISHVQWPTAKITHFTTAKHVLSDKNNDGVVSEEEFKTYEPNIIQAQKIAALIKAVVDFGKADSLLDSVNRDTFALASAAAQNKKFGSSQQTLEEWIEDPSNSNVIDAIWEDIDNDMGDILQNYTHVVHEEVTKVEIDPRKLESYGAYGDIGLSCDTSAKAGDLDISLISMEVDEANEKIVFKFIGDENEEEQVEGGYNSRTGEVSWQEVEPKYVTMIGGYPDLPITYFSESNFSMREIYNAQTGNIKGSFADSWTNSWSISEAKRKCKVEGSFVATKM